MFSSLFWSVLADDGPGMPVSFDDVKKYGLIAIGVVVGFLVLGMLLQGNKRRKPTGLVEELGSYPPAPRPGKRRLLLQGGPVRLRLVVIAPVGKKKFASDGDIEPVLDEVVPGLGDIAAVDKPRVRVWPPQFSIPAFPPTFYRNTETPANQRHNWILVSGTARAEGQPILLGLALWSDKPTKKVQLVLEPNGWSEALRVE